jgi:hypothetical protein
LQHQLPIIIQEFPRVILDNSAMAGCLENLAVRGHTFEQHQDECWALTNLPIRGKVVFH